MEGKKRKWYSPSFLKFIALALICGVGLGALGNSISDGTRNAITMVLEPTEEVTLGIIKMTALVVIFFCVLEAFIIEDNSGSMLRTGVHTIGGFIVTLSVMLVIVSVPCMLMYPLNFSATGEAGAGSGQIIVDTLFGLFPTSIIKPFIEGNCVQIVFLAIILGCGLSALRKKAGGVIKACHQLYEVTAKIMDWVCNLIPLMVFAMIVLNIWNGKFAEAADAWKVIVFILVILVVLVLALTLLTAARTHKGAGDLLKELMPTYIKGLATASSIICYPNMKQNLLKLGVSEKFADFGLPMALTFFDTDVIVVIPAVTICFAHASGVAVSAGWIVTFIILSLLFSLACPPTAGSDLAIIALMFDALGIPAGFLAVATPIVFFLEYPGTGARVGIMVMQLARAFQRTKTKSDS